MAKITLSEPEGPYECSIDTEVMEVLLQNVFTGVEFVTSAGEHLGVCMRDNGFEVHYWADFGNQGFDTGWTEFKDGSIRSKNG